jgi:hypothetical protein
VLCMRATGGRSERQQSIHTNDRNEPKDAG